ncbi:MAG: sn-glycerol-3-phosphate ABC transporter ATP-binding protein UgpC [Devosia sp.]|uniref:ABC transporter ATP-binding protein n=1 Tax=Devosia sp. TaxID=1871048 RepID=UPI0019F7031B|nr:sn-glycerol-3-phosphate ABC transporter ATP-binding protein UgpC [Devosia sp.]MBF0680723.1 sn-glycerol-3-phosphate ABC transporter ATP-binding protein UgpC [Devosia sp.]
MASIQIQNTTKSYGSMQVLHGVDIAIDDGEFVILVGPSGCGKSTLLRMIAGLESISGGDIIIGDRVVNDLPPKARDIAMVFQSYALYPHMSVERNMGFSLKLAGRSKAEINEKVGRAAEILGLNALLQRKPAQLSGGQRQRVAMGRAIVRDPSVFLFDEPLSNLDAQLRVQMRSEIKSLHQRLKTTTVYVTHDQVEAMTMADRIVVMSEGRVEQVGTPLELFDRPANLFVARFIGSPSMNLIEGEIVKADDGVVFEGQGVSIGLGQRDPGLAGRKVVLGIRPDDLSVVSAGEGLAAKVGVVEPTGSETLLHMTLGKKPFLGVFKERLEVKPEQEIAIGFDPARVHLFDAQSRLRIAG